ncbi:MAG: nicotinate-nucleotide adenylyltransferase NadD [Pseudomonadota bacterium]|jgi:nicotinate-nucleotide adenylyltransferase
MSRIGLFGGTFDPVHRAHVALAHAALDALALDTVRWVPTGQPWQKQGSRVVSPAAHRVAMVQAAIAHESRFVLSRIELDRSGPSFTLDTVRALQAAEPGHAWVLLIGQDQYANLHTWAHWRELLARVELAVANRPGPAQAPQPEVQAHPHRMVPLPMLDISSTQIRAAAALGHDLTPMVPPEVARYIARHRLYMGDEPDIRS